MLLPLLAIASSLVQPIGPALTHLAGSILLPVTLNTLALAGLVGVGTAIIGISSAWLVAGYRFPGSRVLEWLLFLPLAMPAYIIGYAYTNALDYPGPVQSALRATFGWSRQEYWFPDIRSLPGAAAMLVLVLYPYVYVLARAAFLDQSANAVNAARALGASGLRLFLRVSVPLARPAIIGGAALAMMEAIADFGTVQYFGVQTLTPILYRTWVGMGDLVAASQLATGLLGSIGLIMLVERSMRGSRSVHNTVKGSAVPGRIQLNGLRGALGFLACALPILLGFVVPVFILLRLHILDGDPLFGTHFLSLTGNSVLLAAAGAILVTGLGAVIATLLRGRPSQALKTLIRIATLGYAVPGTVVAVGVLIISGVLDRTRVAGVQTALSLPGALVFSGTLVTILFAYVVRFAAIGLTGMEAGFAKISPHIDDAARMLGCSGMALSWRIHRPMLIRSLLATFVVLFADILKELPATLILRPFNFDTLAVRAYQLASDERLAEASSSALVIVLVGLLPVFLMIRLTRRA